MDPKILASLIVKNPAYVVGRLKSRLADQVSELKWQFFRNKTDAESPIISKEILVAGMRRSGNHAIINWIENQFDGSGVFLNNLRFGENPYQYISNILEGKGHSRDDFVVKEFKNQRFFQGEIGSARLRDECLGRHHPKDYLIHSYEDYKIKKIFSGMTPARRLRYFGKSKESLSVLILRDPFNMMASRYHSERMDVQHWGASILSLWKDYAKEYIGETNYLINKVTVNYNHWAVSENYRQQLSDRLGLSFNDQGIHSVPSYGGGSSFDKKNFDGEANKMAVNKRWEKFSGDKQFRSFFKDREILQLSQEIFGETEGVECLF